MRFAVAIASPPNFRHSKAFQEVAESLHYGLLALGHESVLTDRLDLDDRRTIVLGGNVVIRHGLKLPKHPIFYNLEQLGGDLPSMTLPGFVDLFRHYPSWDYSQANIERLAGLGLPRPTHVPIGYVPELTRITPGTEDIDVLFYGASYERRYAILRELCDRGLRVKWLSGVYGATRDAWIARSKIVLNLHYWDAKIFEIVRVSYLLANSRTVVSERGADPALERDLESGVAFADYDGLVDRCVELIRDEDARRELAERGYQAFAARDQVAILRDALSGFNDVGRETGGRSANSIDVHTDSKSDIEDLQHRERELFKHKFAPDRDRWLAKVERDPTDARSVFFLAETSFEMDDFANARKWYAHRASMGGCDEEVYWALYRLAASMAALCEPWPDVQEAFLKAWEFRPSRAEALYAIAFHCRHVRRFRLAYDFAQRAAAIPLPEEDLFILGYFAEIYAWRATDEQATCAFWIGKHAEAFALCRRLLTRTDIPEPDRQRIATNRDYSVPTMIDTASAYPDAVVQTLLANRGDAQITVSLVAGPDQQATERTLNSFLHCCLDVSRVGRFVLLDTGLSEDDRAALQERYGFLKFARSVLKDKPASRLAQLRTQVEGRYWLHLGEGWRFFAPDNYVDRLTAVLDAEPHAFQVGINFGDAVTLTGAAASEETVCRTPNAGRYLLTEAMSTGPAMFDVARMDRAVGVKRTGTKWPASREQPAADAVWRTASLDEVLCVSDF